jgi:hypothetical protein
MSESQFAWANALMFSLLEISSVYTIARRNNAVGNGHRKFGLVQLTPGLIPVDDIRDILTNTTARLSADGRKLCASTAKDVYESKSFTIYQTS